MEGENVCREALAAERKRLGDDHPDLIDALSALGEVLRNHGKLSEAKSLRLEALALARRSAKDDAKKLESSLNQLAENLFRQGDYAEAEPLYREFVASRQARLHPEDAEVVSATSSLARLLTDWAWSERGSNSRIRKTRRKISDRAHEAERLLRNCLAIQSSGAKATDWRTGDIKSRLGGALLAVAATDSALANKARVAKLAEAEALLLESNEALQQGKDVESRYKGDSLTRIVHLYQAWQRNDKVAEWQIALADFEQTEATTKQQE